MTELFGSVGVSALVAVFVSSVVSVWGISRNIRLKAVIEQRQCWRNEIRDLVADLVSESSKPNRKRLRAAIILRLNPNDETVAVGLLNQFLGNATPSNADALVAHFQCVLKLEWERAKIEASFRPFCAVRRASRRVERQRSLAAKGGVFFAP